MLESFYDAQIASSAIGKAIKHLNPRFTIRDTTVFPEVPEGPGLLPVTVLQGVIPAGVLGRNQAFKIPGPRLEARRGDGI